MKIKNKSKFICYGMLNLILAVLYIILIITEYLNERMISYDNLIIVTVLLSASSYGIISSLKDENDNIELRKKETNSSFELRANNLTLDIINTILCIFMIISLFIEKTEFIKGCIILTVIIFNLITILKFILLFYYQKRNY
ncbi:hypothetical protein [Peptacetobacter sp.]|uniref:hypothetical protein n=1 Tax=Peptacetobacter sp. TaxID=2991975 RepID=UPI00261921E1|nr:hypothetical protein [Peptacetobacter sp.]